MWCLVGYKWVQGKWKYINRVHNKISETINKTRKIIPLCYIKSNEAMFILGVYLAPDGNNKDQVKYMHKNPTSWAISIIVGGVQQNKSWKALKSATLQTMKYPLSDMTLNKKECKHIIQPIVNFGLTKAGISSTLHTVVRYGPRSL